MNVVEGSPEHLATPGVVLNRGPGTLYVAWKNSTDSLADVLETGYPLAPGDAAQFDSMASLGVAAEGGDCDIRTMPKLLNLFRRPSEVGGWDVTVTPAP